MRTVPNKRGLNHSFHFWAKKSFSIFGSEAQNQASESSIHWPSQFLNLYSEDRQATRRLRKKPFGSYPTKYIHKRISQDINVCTRFFIFTKYNFRLWHPLGIFCLGSPSAFNLGGGARVCNKNICTNWFMTICTIHYTGIYTHRTKMIAWSLESFAVELKIGNINSAFMFQCVHVAFRSALFGAFIPLSKKSKGKRAQDNCCAVSPKKDAPKFHGRNRAGSGGSLQSHVYSAYHRIDGRAMVKIT